MSTRLPGAKYQQIFDRGRPIKGRLLVAWYRSVPTADRQAGVVVSKKTFHDAVDRNRAKRLMREAFRLLVKANEAPPGKQWILIARREILQRTCSQVKEELKWAFSRSLRSPSS